MYTVILKSQNEFWTDEETANKIREFWLRQAELSFDEFRLTVKDSKGRNVCVDITEVIAIHPTKYWSDDENDK